MKFVATSKKVTQQIFPSSYFVAVVNLLYSRWIKIRIRDKHPRSTTLDFFTNSVTILGEVHYRTESHRIVLDLLRFAKLIFTASIYIRNDLLRIQILIWIRP